MKGTKYERSVEILDGLLKDLINRPIVTNPPSNKPESIEFGAEQIEEIRKTAQTKMSEYIEIEKQMGKNRSPYSIAYYGLAEVLSPLHKPRPFSLPLTEVCVTIFGISKYDTNTFPRVYARFSKPIKNIRDDMWRYAKRTK